MVRFASLTGLTLLAALIAAFGAWAAMALAISGPGGVQASFNWQAAKPDAGQMLTVTLTNDVEDYA